MPAKIKKLLDYVPYMALVISALYLLYVRFN